MCVWMEKLCYEWPSRLKKLLYSHGPFIYLYAIYIYVFFPPPPPPIKIYELFPGKLMKMSKACHVKENDPKILILFWNKSLDFTLVCRHANAPAGRGWNNPRACSCGRGSALPPACSSHRTSAPGWRSDASTSAAGSFLTSATVRMAPPLRRESGMWSEETKHEQAENEYMRVVFKIPLLIQQTVFWFQGDLHVFSCFCIQTSPYIQTSPRPLKDVS